MKRLHICLMLVFIESFTGSTEGQIKNGGYTDFGSRPDVDGNHVGGHHGGVIFADGKYWWYGQTFSDGGATTKTGVVMYSSTDLFHWKHERVILSCKPSGPLEGPMRFERSKIIHNDRTKKFVLWCHYVGKPGKHGVEPGTADAGVASCDTINGNYEWHGYHRPLGPDMTVKDSTLFKDSDGKAYFIFDSYPKDKSAERCIYISLLSDDYLKSTDVRKIPNTVNREAPAMIKRNGYYFLITSGVSGWAPNAAKCHRATNIWGPHEDLGNFCVGKEANRTFNAQSTYVFELHDKPGSYVFMGDRWNRKNMNLSAHIWLPLEFPTKDTVRMQYHEEWDLGVFNAQESRKKQ